MAASAQEININTVVESLQNRMDDFRREVSELYESELQRIAKSGNDTSSEVTQSPFSSHPELVDLAENGLVIARSGMMKETDLNVVAHGVMCDGVETYRLEELD